MFFGVRNNEKNWAVKIFFYFRDIEKINKKYKIMALEIRPFPVLTGQAARDFLEKVENFKTTETKEHIHEVKRLVRESVEQSIKLGYL